jgi:hypothetical protein
MRRTLRPHFVALAALALLSACKEEKKPSVPVANALGERVIAATEQSIRVGAPPHMRFRGVQLYAQAMPQKLAVCGQLNPFPDDPDIFVPFVSVVTLPAKQDDPSGTYQFDHRIGTNASEASRTYVAIVNYCYDQGGPAPSQSASAMPAPPLPDRIPDPTAKARGPDPTLRVVQPTQPTAAPSTAQSAASQATTQDPSATATDSTPSSGNVVVRQNANLHSDPHGPSTRVVQQGTSLRVFGQAPGGWYQVGDTSAWGWIHESMIDRR